jgi:hypothetical protein
MIHVSAVLGGPELNSSSFMRALEGIWFPGIGDAWPEPGRAPDPGNYEERREPRPIGSVDVVFHVPGSILKPEHTGLRTGRFSRKECILQVQIAVPELLMESPGLRRYLLASIREAVRLSDARFAKAGIPFPMAEYLSQVDELERRLGEVRIESMEAPGRKGDEAAEQGDEADER